ncbi:MAG TPA: hypothetical protein VMR89_06755 [Actinomycetota bacterium]|nr:hypothetical protein [Actinomycetota bacterium]
MSQPYGRHAARTPPARAEKIARIGWATFLALSLAVVIGAIYLQPFLAEPDRFPHGIDTSVYIFRSRLVHDVGLNELAPFGERPAQPIVTSVLRDIGGGTLLDLARIWPALFAIAIGSAGAALAAGVAGERRWVAVAVGVGLAASPFVALTAIGYASNLLLDVFAVAAIALAVRVGTGRKGAAALVLLIGAAAIAHWLFAIGLAALLLAYAAGVFVFERIRRRPEGARTQHPARLLVIVGFGVLLGALALFASPDLPHKVPTAKQDATAKIAARLPEMKLAITIPLAAAGAAIMLLFGTPATRRTAVPLAMWALAAPAGLLAWKVLDMTIPHIVPFALGVPSLIVLGAAATRLWTVARSSRLGGAPWGIAGAVTSAVLVLASAAWLSRAGADTWSDQQAGFTRAQIEQASTLAAYLETIPPETPVVVPVRPGVWRPLQALQVTLPVKRFLSVKTWRVDFFGDTREFRRRLASRHPSGTVAVSLAGYSDQAPLQGTSLGPGVTVLAGPEPPSRLSVAPIEPADGGELIRLTAVSVATVLLVGLGWTLLMTGLPAFAAVCLSPAIGIAVLSIGGLIAGRLGFPLGRGGGVIAALAIGTLGWLAFAVGSLRRAPDDGPADGPADGPDHEDDLEPPSPTTTGPADTGGDGRHVAGEPSVRSQ